MNEGNVIKMSSLRKEVLRQFKNLHRTRLSVFDGDQRALEESRKWINDEFHKNKNISEPAEIEKLVKIAKDVEIELRTNVIQAVQKKPGVFEVKLRPDTPFLDNIPFRENDILPEFKGPKCGSKSK